jgi:hypothetical protein
VVLLARRCLGGRALLITFSNKFTFTIDFPRGCRRVAPRPPHFCPLERPLGLSDRNFYDHYGKPLMRLSQSLTVLVKNPTRTAP